MHIISNFQFAAEVLCCKWDGCNSDTNSAKLSRVEYEKYLLQQILGSEYDHFVPTKNEPFDGGGESSKQFSTGISLSQGISKDILGNEGGTGNRRAGSFSYGNVNQYDHAGTQSENGASNIFANGFPKYFVPKLQVLCNA